MKQFVALCKKEEQGYSCRVKELPGCFTQSMLFGDIKDKIIEAISCHINESPENISVTLTSEESE